MYSSCSLILVGDELLSGRTRDVNLHRFANFLSLYNLPIVSSTVVPDSESAIGNAVLNSLSDKHVVIVTGGLGPTDDDLTLKSVSSALGLPLVRNQEAESFIREKYTDQTLVTDSALTQADVPESATVVNNPVGIAPGVLLKIDKSLVICLPGVPSESIALIEPCLLKAGIDKSCFATPLFIRTWGLKENPLFDSLKSIREQFNSDLSFLPSPGRVDIKVAGPEARDCFKAISEKLKCHVYSHKRDETLEEVLAKKLIKKSATLSTAESCTGGGIGASFTEIPGVSKCYLGGMITYSNEMKTNLLGVPASCIEAHGAVSSQTVLHMAKGVREKTGSDYSIAITGIAGPSGGTPLKPVGTVWTALSSIKSEKAFCWTLGGTRNQIRQGAISRALGTLFEALYSG